MRAILEYVHGYLDYAPGERPRAVLALVTTPRGDCTEFADLFTTLARSAGFSARTVFGLAYSETPDPAFAFHAWNEVEIDGRWTAVDPTWNQMHVDATHIPLAPEGTAAMRLLTGAMQLRFEVQEVEYLPD